jgi:hypothetical protein
VSSSNEGLLSLLRLIAKHADFARSLRRVVFAASPAALRMRYSAYAEHAEREFAKQLHRHGILGPARRLPALCEVALRDAPPVLRGAAAADNKDECDPQVASQARCLRAFRWEADLQEVLAPQPPRNLLL